MAGELPNFDDECFVITEIGKKDSPERRRADGVLRSVIEPAAADRGLVVVRADQIAKGGQVNLQIIEHVCKSKAAVADLTGGNLNVYYEVGMRHTVRKPLALIAEEGEDLPFDLLQQRTIFFRNDLEGGAACRDSLIDHLREADNGTIDSPVDAALNVGVLAQGDETQRALAELVQKIDVLTGEVHKRVPRNRGPSPAAVSDLVDAWLTLADLAADEEDERLDTLMQNFRRPILHLARHTQEPVARKRSDRWQEGMERLGQRPVPAETVELSEEDPDNERPTPTDSE